MEIIQASGAVVGQRRRGGTGQLKEPYRAAQAGRPHRLPARLSAHRSPGGAEGQLPPWRGQEQQVLHVRQQVSARHGYSTNRHSPVMAAHLAGRQPGPSRRQRPPGASHLACPGSNPGPATTSQNNPLASPNTVRGLSCPMRLRAQGGGRALAATARTRAKPRGVCGALRRRGPERRSRPCVALPGGDDVPASRAGKDGLPRRGQLGPQAAAQRAAVPRAAVPRAAVPRAAVPPLAARARHRPVPGG